MAEVRCPDDWTIEEQVDMVEWMDRNILDSSVNQGFTFSNVIAIMEKYNEIGSSPRPRDKVMELDKAIDWLGNENSNMEIDTIRDLWEQVKEIIDERL